MEQTISLAEKGEEALILIAENGGWDDISDVASELNKTVEELSEVYFETAEEVDVEERSGTYVDEIIVYLIHKGSLVPCYRGPATVNSKGQAYFDYAFNELDA